MGGQAVRPELEDLAVRARADLVREIEASGAFEGDPVWREVFAAVPRHLFVPSYYVGVAGGYERRWCGDPAPGGRGALAAGGVPGHAAGDPAAGR